MAVRTVFLRSSDMYKKAFLGTAFVLSAILSVCSCDKSKSEPQTPPEPPVPAVDLTPDGKYANCFIVSEPGTYDFAAFRADGTQVTDASSADWLWSEGASAASALVRDVSFSEGRIRFTAASGRGNAVIAALDKDGQIVWSWHIWLTEQPALQTLDNGTVFMDRNLGATASKPSDGAATYGLKYQWGRKDPFYGGAYNETDKDEAGNFLYEAFVRAKGYTVFNPSLGCDWGTMLCGAQTGTVDYAVKHPSTFIYTTPEIYGADNDVRDWMWVRNSYLWSAKNTGAKTAYDPCPAGYRVPDDDAWEGTGYYNIFDKGDGGKTHTTSAGEVFWWPLCGTRWGDKDAGRLGYVYQPENGGGQLIIWMRTTELCGTSAACFYSLGGTYTGSSYGMYRAHGGAVRCVKEQ